MQKILREIISKSASLNPEKAFDLIASLTNSVSFMQFVPTKIQYVIPLINQAVRFSKAIGKNFITTTLEEDLVSNTIFCLQDIYNNIFNKTEKIICVVARKDNFLNNQTEKNHQTWILLIDCYLAVKITDYIIKNNLNMKTIRHANKRRFSRGLRNGMEPIAQRYLGISSDVAAAAGFGY